MASGAANPDYHSVLVASTVDTVTIPAGVASRYRLYSDGTARIDYTIDGSTPVVGGSATGLVVTSVAPAEDIFDVNYNTGATVKLISSGTPHYDLEPVAG